MAFHYVTLHHYVRLTDEILPVMKFLSCTGEKLMHGKLWQLLLREEETTKYQWH